MTAYPATFELPTTDGLTGLLSSAYFRHLLREEALPGAEQTGDPLAMLLIDIDAFMSVNERFGHRTGDAVIEGIARALKETLPDTALVARYGGDEFASAMPDMRLDDAFTLAEELRRKVAALRWEQWPDLSVTCSMGLAAYPANGSRDVELIREADQAVYVAKATGRNKVALPFVDSRMVTKTSHYTSTQLERLTQLAKTVKRNEARLLREALDDLLKKYNDLLRGAPPRDK